MGKGTSRDVGSFYNFLFLLVIDWKPKCEEIDIIDEKESNFEKASNETIIAKHEFKRTDSPVEERERDSYTGLRKYVFLFILV